jgi:hypothetical protein
MAYDAMSVEKMVDAFDDLEAEGHVTAKAPIDYESLPVFVESDVEGYRGMFMAAKGVRLAQVRAVFRRPGDGSFVYEEIMPADDGPWHDKERELAVVIDTHNDFTNADDDDEK